MGQRVGSRLLVWKYERDVPSCYASFLSPREERGERRATMTVSEVTSAGGTQFIRVPLVNVGAWHQYGGGAGRFCQGRFLFVSLIEFYLINSIKYLSEVRHLTSRWIFAWRSEGKLSFQVKYPVTTTTVYTDKRTGQWWITIEPVDPGNGIVWGECE